MTMEFDLSALELQGALLVLADKSNSIVISQSPHDIGLA